MCIPQTGWNYIGNSTCLKTRRTVQNIHKLLYIQYKCKWCFAYLSFIWKRVLKTNLIKKKKKKKKNLPHLELKKKKKLAPLGTENKKTFLARLGKKKTCPDPNFLLPPPLKSNGASLNLSCFDYCCYYANCRQTHGACRQNLPLHPPKETGLGTPLAPTQTISKQIWTKCISTMWPSPKLF